MTPKYLPFPGSSLIQAAKRAYVVVENANVNENDKVNTNGKSNVDEKANANVNGEYAADING